MVGKLFIVSAPSGAGKTSLVSAVLHKIPSQFLIQRIITYTTKQPRLEEAPGIDYHYISISEFEQKIRERFFLEYSSVYEHYYGTPRSVLHEMQAGRSYIAIIDRIGAEKILAQCSDAVPIWIYTKSIMVLKERLLKRGTDNLEVIERRIIRAQKELELEERNRLYMYHIVNDDFDTALTQLYTIVCENITSE